MSDSGTVELTRECGLEGIKRITCTGKQDNIDLLKRELMCLSERENENAEFKESVEDQQKTSSSYIVSSTATPMMNVNEPVSDQIEKPIEKSLNGDIPISPVTEVFTPSKPLKPMKKVASEKPLKNQPKLLKKYKWTLNKNMDDMMMGDQPVQYIPKIEDVLPHMKKALKLDEPEHKPTTTQSNELPTSTTITQHEQSSSTELPTTKQEIVSSDSNTRSRRNSDASSTPVLASTTESTIGIVSTETTIVTTELIANVSIESITEKMVEAMTVSHNSTQSASDHFVPPMLLVHHEDLAMRTTSKDAALVSTTATSVEAGTTAEAAVTATTTAAPVTPTNAAVEVTTTTTTTTTEPIVQSTSGQTSPEQTTSEAEPTSVQPTTAPEVASSTTTVTTPTTTVAPVTEPSTTTVSTSTAHVHTTPTSKSNAMMRPHAPKHAGEIHYHAPNAPVEKTETAATKPDTDHMPARNPNFIAEISNDIHDKKAAVNLAISTNSVDLSQSTSTPHDNGNEHGESHGEPGSDDEANKRRADFTNSDVEYKPYKPNRRRVLTKPDSHSYIQRVFGRR